VSSSEGDLLILYAIGGDLANFSRLIRMSDNDNLKNYQDNLGKTPLMHAIKNGRRNIIEYLLHSGASIKSIGSDTTHGVVDALYYEDTWNRDHPQDQMNYIRKIGNVLGGVFGEFPLRSESTETRGSVHSTMSDLTDRNDYGETSRSPSVFNERGGKKRKNKRKSTTRKMKKNSKRRRKIKVMSKRR
jgi:ankyrin repeat protein